ncbi:bilirubin utilization transcriptional regulator BilQ [Angelakisella massiliensis]|uniref:bilirubin utilization transcriptional regulator BilQ n=1 Tax=Angelakisella massiliensis TaxID=1871018 RepID=UPI0008F95953|nr:bilirubin utilization transcriptional regulator BilQ [Angelakisella massiliensis]
MQHTLSYHIICLQKDFVRFCNTRLGEMGLSRGLLFFLIYIGKHPGCSHTALSRALGMDTGHTTRSIAKLVETGFAIREPNPSDRRGLVLHLTPKGEETFHKIYELFVEWDELVFGHLASQQREDLTLLLDEVLTRRLESHPGLFEPDHSGLEQDELQPQHLL